MSRTRRWLLAIDTATNTIVVAAGSVGGQVIARHAVEGRYRHSQELLPAMVGLMERASLGLPDLAGIIVGTGPGAFTGLRVGLATAKTLAHELGVPVVGILTSDALLAAANDGAGRASAILWLPSGSRDRIAVVAGEPPTIVRAGEPGPSLAASGQAIDAPDIAVDLECLTAFRRAGGDEDESAAAMAIRRSQHLRGPRSITDMSAIG